MYYTFMVYIQERQYMHISHSQKTQPTQTLKRRGKRWHNNITRFITKDISNKTLAKIRTRGVTTIKRSVATTATRFQGTPTSHMPEQVLIRPNTICLDEIAATYPSTRKCFMQKHSELNLHSGHDNLANTPDCGFRTSSSSATVGIR